MTEELTKQIYGGELTAEATKLLKYIYAGAQPIEDNDFAMMFGRMNLAKFVEVKAKEDEIVAKQSKKLKDEYQKINSRLSTSIKDKEQDIDILTKSLQEANKYIKDLEQEITQLEDKVSELDSTKDSSIDELKAERDKLRDQITVYKMDNGDLQADIDRLRHQLGAIKNVIAL